MSDSGAQNPQFSRKFSWEFSPESEAAIKEILIRLWTKDEKKIGDLIESLGSARSYGVDLEDRGDPRIVRQNLRTLEESVTKYLSSEKNLGIFERLWLSDSIDEDTEDQELAKYDEPTSNPDIKGMYGSTLNEIRSLMKVLESAIANAQERLEVRRGPKPNVNARYLAMYVHEALDERGIRTTSYDDGIFFEILSIVFGDAYPDQGPEAYRGYGNWILRAVAADPEDGIDAESIY